MSDANPKPTKLMIASASIVIVAAILIAPLFIRRGKHRDPREDVSNLRQIGLALYEFEAEYGAYPSEATAALVTKKHPDHGYDLSGNSSNAMFRQLFAAGLTQSEAMFYAKAHSARKPDGDIRPGHLLERDEVGFGYIASLTEEGNPARPIAFAPIIPGTKKFDPKPFDRKAFILRIDNSVASLRIDDNGHARMGGKTLFETGADTVWGEVTPDIRYPE